MPHKSFMQSGVNPEKNCISDNKRGQHRNAARHDDHLIPIYLIKAGYQPVQFHDGEKLQYFEPVILIIYNIVFKEKKYILLFFTKGTYLRIVFLAIL